MGRLQDIVTARRRRMAGHVLRLQTERSAHTAMYSLPEDGRRKRGGQRRHGGVRSLEVKEMGVSWHGARRFASDRDGWRHLG